MVRCKIQQTIIVRKKVGICDRWGRYEGDFTLYTHDVAGEMLLTICNMLLNPAQSMLIGKRTHVVEIVGGQTVEILGERYTFFDIQSSKAKQFGFRQCVCAG